MQRVHDRIRIRLGTELDRHRDLPGGTLLHVQAAVPIQQYLTDGLGLPLPLVLAKLLALAKELFAQLILEFSSHDPIVTLDPSQTNKPSTPHTIQWKIMNRFAALPTTWPVTLDHQGLELAPLRYSHRKQWHEVRRRNLAWLTPWEATDPTGSQAPMTYGSMVRAHNRDGAAGVSYPWAIFQTPPGETRAQLVGQLIAAPVLWGSMRSTSLGYWVDQAHAGQNIVPTAVALASDYLFTRVRLHRIEINIVPDNAPSLRVVEKLGFRSEGIRKNYIHINGQWRDHESFALTRDELPSDGLLSRLH